ncbi:Rz-like spanin [Shigella phage vB_SsoS-ISF002]|uniref:RzlA n=1 Tax=Shigella phage vB_SsoS-ISF002 TaxID=2006922 RepID=A0A218M464_9CAUD|nr:Rz-like spanin [Shigella phage vB_SsoS-ISF002]ASD50886.1 hypothetical protein ISF001_002 [Shigella phage vB_SsoS-ISF002]
MKLKKTCIAITVAVGVISLSGCSTASALSGLIGSKPEVTAQIGEENTKQLAGVTAKSEDKRDVKVEKSNVGKIDSSLKKSIEVSTIKANTVNAESITVTKPENWYDAIAGWTLVFIGLLLVYFSIRKDEKKEAKPPFLLCICPHVTLVSEFCIFSNFKLASVTVHLSNLLLISYR